MKRPSPSNRFLTDLFEGAANREFGRTGGHKKTRRFALALYGGLRETPSLAEVYTQLDFRELVAFAASSWETRRRNDWQDGTLYGIFRRELRRGIPRARDIMRIPREHKPFYDRLNPYGSERLVERLDLVDNATADRLRDELQKEARLWLPEYQYELLKRDRGSNAGLQVACEVPKYASMRNGNFFSSYVKEIGKMMRKMPRQLEPLPAVTGQQMGLFE